MNLYAALPKDSKPLTRRAALTVHAMGHTDRAWLLAQLPSAERERLQSMLAELTGLGIPGNRSLLDDVLGVAVAAPANPDPRLTIQNNTASTSAIGLAQKQAALSRLDPAVVATLLQAEPAGMIAHLLSIHPWPWHHAVLEQLSLTKRRRVDELLCILRLQVRVKVPEALHKTLVETVYSRLAGSAKVLAHGEAASNAVLRMSPSHASRWIAKLPGWLQPLLARRK